MATENDLVMRRKKVDAAELGSYAKLVSTNSILNAFKLVKEGRVYDLGLERFHGMPLPGMHPPLEILTYRSTRGMKNQQDQQWISGDSNQAQFGFTSELVITSLHTGTHIDTLSHPNAGPKHTWYGGYSTDEYVGDFGTLKSDASSLPPFIARGVLLDVARYEQVDVLPQRAAITREIIEKTAKFQQVQLRPGDIILIRTGYMSLWPDKEKLSQHNGSGINLSAAEWLAAHQPMAIGTDTEAIEQFPGDDPGNPHPVHTFFLVKNGIFMIECLDLEALSKDRRYEFLFIALPVKFRGGTAGLMDPVAVI